MPDEALLDDVSFVRVHLNARNVNPLERALEALQRLSAKRLKSQY